MPGRLDETFQIDGGAGRNQTQSPRHRILYIAALTSRDHVGVGADHCIYIRVVEIIGENVDRITAEQFETAGSQQAVPKFFELDGGGEFASAPQDSYHLAVCSKTAIQRPRKQPLDLATYGLIKPLPIGQSRYYEFGECLRGVTECEAADVLCRSQVGP